MRRMLGWTLALLLAVLPATPAFAQGIGLVGPGGVVYATSASVSAVNTVSAIPVFSYAVPGGLYATGSNTNIVPPVRTPPVLHYTARGTINTNASPGQIGAINFGANFGGSTATIALLNAHTPAAALTNTPIRVDVWVTPLATAIGANTVVVQGRVSYVGASSTETVVNSTVLGTTLLNAPSQTLAVNWQWGSATNTNSVTFYGQQLIIGN